MKYLKCIGPIDGWSEDIYQIDKESQGSRKYAIWHNNKWCISGIKTIKNAINILKQEFTSVTKCKYQ